MYGREKNIFIHNTKEGIRRQKKCPVSAILTPTAVVLVTKNTTRTRTRSKNINLQTPLIGFITKKGLICFAKRCPVLHTHKKNCERKKAKNNSSCYAALLRLIERPCYQNYTSTSKRLVRDLNWLKPFTSWDYCISVKPVK